MLLISKKIKPGPARNRGVLFCNEALAVTSSFDAAHVRAAWPFKADAAIVLSKLFRSESLSLLLSRFEEILSVFVFFSDTITSRSSARSR